MKKIMRSFICLLLCEILLFNTLLLSASALNADAEKAMPVVVSLGDSYSSGEGIEPYYDQFAEPEQKYTSEDWIAHRSTAAWPGLLEFNGIKLNEVRAQNPICTTELHQSTGEPNGCWYFAAVSGAETQNISSSSNKDKQGKSVIQQTTRWNPDPDYNHRYYGLNFQIDTIKNLPNPSDVEYVTLTIGGNDIGFVEVMNEATTKTMYLDWDWCKSSLVDHLFQKIDTFWKTNDDSTPLAKKLLDTYTCILDAAPNATLVIAGYPELINIDDRQEGLDILSVSKAEAIYINSSIRVFNSYIRNIIENSLPIVMPGRTAIFVDVEDAFRTHRAYSPTPYINGLCLGFQENVDTSGINFVVNSKSYHPNEKGAQAYADAVQEKIKTASFYNSAINLSVQNLGGKLYDVQTQGKEFQGLFKTGALWRRFQKSYLKNNDSPLLIDLPSGDYTITVLDSETQQIIGRDHIKVRENGARRSMLFKANNDASGSDAYIAYLSAAQKTTESGRWSENLSVTANMSITDSSGKTKTKLTMISNADISDYSENNLSQVRISGNAEMTAMGQTYVWKMRYENGMAHYDYTQPNQTSTDMAIDPSFFNFGTMKSDMMTMAKLSGNQITFTVPGAKINEVGLAAVSQMSGVDNLNYGDVDVTVTISKDGTIDAIAMKFHASLSYQGYDADVDYDLVYQFTPHEGGTSEATTPPYDISNLVSDAYYDYVANTLYNAEGFYHIPKVNANLPEIDKTNGKIYDDYYGYMQTQVYGPIEGGSNTPIEKISYIWGVKDQYLSILMLVIWGSEPICEVYTVSLETGELVDNDEVLTAYNMTKDEFLNRVDQASAHMDEKLLSPVPYINPGNGDLCAACTSADWGWSVLINVTGDSKPVYPWETKEVREKVTEQNTTSDSGSLSIQPGYYVEEGNEHNTLTVRATTVDSVAFNVLWYRVWDIYNAIATGSGDTVYFDYTKSSASASGYITFADDSAVLTLEKCNNPNIHIGDYYFKQIGRIFTNEQLAEIGSALNVPSSLSVEYKQGEPSYWEGGGFYRTEVEILHNGELIAGASVDSMTGGLAGNILTYSDSSYTAQTERTGYVSESAGELNIRSGPGTEYPSIGRLRANEEVTIYETRNSASATWGRISDEGWVCLDYITFSDS